MRRRSPLVRSEPVGVGQLREHAPQAFAPLVVDELEVRIVFLDAPLQRDLETPGLVDEQVDRQADRNVRAHRRVERHDRALRRVEQRRAPVDDAVDHRLAVLRLADLEVAGVGRRLDEVAFAVHLEKPRRLALQLPPTMKLADESMLFWTMYGPSRARTSRSASPSS